MVQWAVATLLLAAVLWMHEATTIDFVIQDRIYQGESEQWLVRKDSKIPRIAFYHGPKVALIALGTWWLLSALLAGRQIGERWRSRRSRLELVYLLVCLAAFPALIGAFKKASGVYCPSELARYGGDHEFRRLIDPRPEGESVGHCFPAGHASGGFALLALAYVAHSKSRRAVALAIALGMGLSMGIYQMLVGAHFLTHTLATLLLAWLFTSVIYWLILGRRVA